MATTLLLDQETWDWVLDANGNWAVASEPYSTAQDAASAIRTFLADCYWDQTLGIDYVNIFSKRTPMPVLIQMLQAQALTVPDVASATVVITDLIDRTLYGAVTITSTKTGTSATVPFQVTSLQGTG